MDPFPSYSLVRNPLMKSIPWLAALSVLAVLCGTRPLEAQDKLKRADVFGPNKLWNIHLRLGAMEYQALQPKGGGFGFPFGKKDNPPPQKKEKEKPKDPAERTDVPKNKAFRVQFPFVK